MTSDETASPGRTWIAIGEDRVWVASPSTVYAVDPVDGRVTLGIDVGGVTGLAAGEEAVWVIDDLSGTLLRLDPVSGEQTGSTNIPGSLDDVAAGGGSVWILDRGAGTITVLDPVTLEATDTIRVGSDEREMKFGAGALWLADGDDRSVTRVNPLTLQASIFPVGAPAWLIAIGDGTDDVWVVLGSE